MTSHRLHAGLEGGAKRGRVPPMFRLTPAVLLLLVVGCQDYETGVQTVCNAPRDCAQCKDADAQTRDLAMKEHLERSVRNDRAKALIASLTTVDEAERPALLTEAATEAGLSRCILAEFYADRASEPAPSSAQ